MPAKPSARKAPALKNVTPEPERNHAREAAFGVSFLANVERALPSEHHAEQAYAIAAGAAIQEVKEFLSLDEREQIVDEQIPFALGGATLVNSDKYKKPVWEVSLVFASEGGPIVQRMSVDQTKFRDVFFGKINELLVERGGEPIPGWKLVRRDSRASSEDPEARASFYDFVPWSLSVQ